MLGPARQAERSLSSVPQSFPGIWKGYQELYKIDNVFVVVRLSTVRYGVICFGHRRFRISVKSGFETLLAMITNSQVLNSNRAVHFFKFKLVVAAVLSKSSIETHLSELVRRVAVEQGGFVSPQNLWLHCLNQLRL